MNEKLQYAEMLEIPVNTCNITYKPPKKRKAREKRVDVDKVKAELVDKINAEQGSVEYQPTTCITPKADEDLTEQSGTQSLTVDIKQELPTPKKRIRGISVVGVQLCVIGLLLATIFLTNAIFTDSGLNTFFRSVFSAETQTVDERDYSEFAPVINLGNTPYALENGVITFSGAGSTYSPCDGTVLSVNLGEDGKYTMEIAHSNNFKTLVSGLDSNAGDTVKANIPVGYVLGDNATICFYDGDAVITDFTIDQNSVVWAV